MLRRGGAGRAKRAVSDGDVRRMGAMGWIIAMLAVTMVALAVTVALMALRSRWKGKANTCILRAMKRYMAEHGLGLTDEELAERAKAEVEEMRKKGELP